MAKKKVVTTEESDEHELGSGAEGELIDDPLSEILAQYPNANRKIRVSRYTPAGPEFVCSSTEMIDEEFLQQEHGAGRYLVKVLIDGVKRLEYELRIAGKPGTRQPSNGSAMTTAVESKTVVGSESDFLKTLVLALINRGSQQSTPVGELTTAIRDLHSISGGSNGSQQFTDGLKQGIELGKGLSRGGGSDWKSDLMQTVRDVVPQLGGMVARGVPQPAPVHTTNLRVVTPEQLGANPVRTPLDELLFTTIQTLKSQCMNQTSVDLVIDYALSSVNDVKTQELIRACFTRDFAGIVAIDPTIGVEPFVTWFKQLFDGLRYAFKTPDDVDDHSGGPTGDQGDTANHGAAGA